MDIKVSLSGRGAYVKAQIFLDFRNRNWAVRQQAGWSLTGLPMQGRLSKLRSDLHLFDPNSDVFRNYFVLKNGPGSELEASPRTGQGYIEAPTNRRFANSTVNWSQHSDLSPIRNQILSIIRGAGFQFSPNYKPDFPSGEPSDKVKAAAKQVGIKSGTGKVSNCGEFPGWIIKQLGERVPKGLFTYVGTGGWGKVNAASPTIGWNFVAKGAERRRRLPAGSIWVPFEQNGPKPKPGDIYIIANESSRRRFAHCGIVINANSNPWITADCGQGGGYAGCYQRRNWDGAAGTLTLHVEKEHSWQPDAGTRWISGWVNVDALLNT